jgi:hypothetical protein
VFAIVSIGWFVVMPQVLKAGVFGFWLFWEFDPIFQRRFKLRAHKTLRVSKGVENLLG